LRAFRGALLEAGNVVCVEVTNSEVVEQPTDKGECDPPRDEFNRYASEWGCVEIAAEEIPQLIPRENTEYNNPERHRPLRPEERASHYITERRMA